MVAGSDQPAVVDEIATLLDQCTSEELTNILNAIEGNAPVAAALPAAAPPSAAPAQQALAPETAAAAQAAPPLVPMVPAGPPPSNGRRPARRSPKKADGAGELPGAELPAGVIPVEDLMRILEEHSASVIGEVQKILPTAGTGAETIDMGVLAEALLERDREVQKLETRLAELQASLADKDRRVADLGCELDATVREVRHRQLDLELQQLKLDERVRSNAELEMVQRSLSMRVEEAALNARHAALDLDLSRSLSTPRGIRAQGALPWTLRKNRLLPAVGGATFPEGASPPRS
mmetsp:Transcript_80717/g.218838  ORF Transcript_80717/g.218838 Transcript_80717/m.218838 type:complete len:292 (-) Transcript_80717:167-1042(-)